MGTIEYLVNSRESRETMVRFGRDIFLFKIRITISNIPISFSLDKYHY